jgi:hypothetical protein
LTNSRSEFILHERVGIPQFYKWVKSKEIQSQLQTIQSRLWATLQNPKKKFGKESANLSTAQGDSNF